MRVPGDTMTWSDEAYRIFGYDRTVTPGPDLVLARAYPEDLPLVISVRDQMRQGVHLIDVRHRLRMPDGTVKHVHLVSRLRESASDYTEYVGALMDITAAVQTQQALQRTSTELAHVMRMTTLGELAASIAHEVTQPIAAIVTCGDSALRWLNRRAAGRRRGHPVHRPDDPRRAALQRHHPADPLDGAEARSGLRRDRAGQPGA